MRTKVHLVTCGFCCHPECSCIAGGRFKSVEFPVHVAVIDHPGRGLMLFDTGYADHLRQATQSWPYCVYPKVFPFQIPYGQTAVEQVKKLGYALSDVKWIFVSHFHPDHVAGLKDFPAAQVICSRVAWEALAHQRGFGALRHCFIPELLPMDIFSRLRWIEDCADISLATRLLGFEQGKDLFGCGKVLAVPLEGHAVGHYGLYLPETAAGRDVFLVADACWRSASYRRYILPPSPVVRLLYDPERYCYTLLQLHRLSLVHDDIAIIPAHCDDVAMLLSGGVG